MNQDTTSVSRRMLDELNILTPTVFEDDRGRFFESFKSSRFVEETGADVTFVQDNQSRSSIGVLRGLHYQLEPSGQGKLVSCLRGAIFDVAVDIRRTSPTFGDWFGTILSERNLKQLWIPVGFAHAFLALEDVVDVFYKVTEYYSPQHDRGIRWDDLDIGIDWPDVGIEPILSEKDADAPFLRDAEIFE